MNNAEEQPGTLTNLLKLAQEYGLTVLTLWKYKALDKVSDIVSSIIIGFILVMLLLMVFITVTIGLAMWIGAIIGHYWVGFFIVAGIYMLMVAIIKMFLQKWMKRVIADNIVKNVLK